MLLELKRKAIEADQAFDEFDETISEWKNILGCSKSFNKIKDLDISEESNTFFENLANVSDTIDRSYAELMAKKEELLLEYALAKLGGQLGDIIYFIDDYGKQRAIIIEYAYRFGEDVAIYGTRFLKSGRKGKLEGSVRLELNKWRLNKPFNIKK